MADFTLRHPIALEKEVSKTSVVKLKKEGLLTLDNSTTIRDADGEHPAAKGLRLDVQTSESVRRGNVSGPIALNQGLSLSFTKSASGGSPKSPTFSVIYEDDIFTEERMESFRAAFPTKALFSETLSHHIVQTSIATPSSIGDKGESIRVLKRPSALPQAAENGKLQWRNINVFVGNKSDGKQILHDISGQILSGELLALMGGSGAGMFTVKMCCDFDLSTDSLSFWTAILSLNLHSDFRKKYVSRHIERAE